MTEYTPTTGKVRNCYSSGRLVLDNDGTSPSEREAEFYRWLDRVRADAWDEGFDAGERDVFEHEHTSFDAPCIRNPYRKESAQ